MGKKSLETIKEESAGLGAPLAEELTNDSDHFTEAARQILKFHGTYQQHDRDIRGRKNREYSFMVRTKLPAGHLTAEQYLAHDRLAGEYANGTLRLTTRQTIQFHGVLKGDLRAHLRQLNDAFITTLGACGDIVRNVMACPAPFADTPHRTVQQLADELSEALTPQTPAYHQIWLDGEKLIDETPLHEPLYGESYLPRKFKIGIAVPGDNCVDVYTQDVGLVALFSASDDDNDDTLEGYNVLVGGGMGRTHNNEETFARLGDLIGFITPEQVRAFVEAAVKVHRDYGDRENRKHARLKYILHDWGVEKFKETLHDYLDFELQAPRRMPVLKNDDHLGWHEQGDGRIFVGLHVLNGRIKDEDDYRLRDGVRAIVSEFGIGVRVTPQQNLLLVDIAPADKEAIDNQLREYGIHPVDAISKIRRYHMACPALPTCGLAITESERVSPRIINEFEMALNEVGLGDEAISVRMTGCPNGCSRPYVAEIAFVGQSLDKYQLLLGGSFNGDRLATEYIDLVHIDDLMPTLKPLLTLWRDERESDDERFGDYINRVGFDYLRDQTELNPERA